MAAPFSFLGRQAYILASPKLTTLSDTSAILKALQSFGPVMTFLNPRYVPALSSTHDRSKLYVIYRDREALDKALEASPLVVDVGHDAVDPEEADPFNVRGFWERKRVERKTIRCLVCRDSGAKGPDGTWNRRVVEANAYHGPFRVDRMAVSFEDLMRQGAPSAEFADYFQKQHLGEADRKRFEEEARRRSFYLTGENGESMGGLMDTWRENLGSKVEKGPNKDSMRKP